MPTKFLDLTGQRFGLLTCLYPTSESHHKCKVWMCRCDCGRRVKVSTGAMRQDGRQHCGCLERGQKVKEAWDLLTREKQERAAARERRGLENEMRARDMVRRIAKGESVKEIAKVWGLSPQRVRQILQEHQKKGGG